MGAGGWGQGLARVVVRGLVKGGVWCRGEGARVLKVRSQ